MKIRERLGIFRSARIDLARTAFWAVVVLSPFRLRAILASHDVPPVWHDYTDLRIFAVDLALVALLVTWSVSLRATGRRPARIPALVAAPGLILLGLIWAGVPGSLDPRLSIAGALEVTAFAGLAWFVATEVRNPVALAAPVALMVALQSVVALGQVAVQGSVGLAWLGEIGLDPAASGIGIVASDAGVRLLRGYGLSDHPNILGGVLAVGLLALVGGLASATTGPRMRPVRIILAGASGLGALALAITFSRAAWVALVAATLVAATLEVYLMSRRHSYPANHRRGQPGDRRSRYGAARPWLALGGGVLLVVAALAVPFGPFLAARLGVDAERPPAEVRSIDERIWLAREALNIVAADPGFGTGLGTLPQAMATGRPLPYRPQPAHVVPLTIAAENGIPAAVAFCLLMLGAMATVVRKGRRGEFAPGAAGTAIGLLVVVVVIGGFEYYPWVLPAGRTWLAIALGATVGLMGASPGMHSPATGTAG